MEYIVFENGKGEKVEVNASSYQNAVEKVVKCKVYHVQDFGMFVHVFSDYDGLKWYSCYEKEHEDFAFQRKEKETMEKEKPLSTWQTILIVFWVIAICASICASGLFAIASSSKEKAECINAGYAGKIKWNGDIYCIGILDGDPTIELYENIKPVE